MHMHTHIHHLWPRVMYCHLYRKRQRPEDMRFPFAICPSVRPSVRGCRSLLQLIFPHCRNDISENISFKNHHLSADTMTRKHTISEQSCWHGLQSLSKEPRQFMKYQHTRNVLLVFLQSFPSGDSYGCPGKVAQPLSYQVFPYRVFLQRVFLQRVFQQRVTLQRLFLRPPRQVPPEYPKPPSYQGIPIGFPQSTPSFPIQFGVDANIIM